MESPIKVVVVDDNACMVWGLKHLVESQESGITIVDAVSRRCDVLQSVRHHRPDVVLLEIALEEQSGLDLIGLVNEGSPAKVVIFTDVRDPAAHDRAILAGAQGLVLKSDPVEVVLRAIKAVHAGELWLKRNVTAKIVGMLAAAYHHSLSPASNSTFTPSEVRVIAAAVKCRGAPNKVVASVLHMSPNTFRNHLSTIYAKLGIHRRLDLVLYGIQHRMGGETRTAPTCAASDALRCVPAPDGAGDAEIRGSLQAEPDKPVAVPEAGAPQARQTVKVPDAPRPGTAVRLGEMLLNGSEAHASDRFVKNASVRLVKSSRPSAAPRHTRR